MKENFDGDRDLKKSSQRNRAMRLRRFERELSQAFRACAFSAFWQNVSMGLDVTGAGKAAKPLTKAVADLASVFFKPAATEAGLWMGERVGIFRQRNIEKVLSRAKAKLEADKIPIQPVPARIFLALAEACSLEDEDEMVERWANLLASAASNGSVLPSYVRTLAELSPAEARVLDAVPRLRKDIKVPKTPTGELIAGGPIFGAELKDIRSAEPMPEDNFLRVIVNLQRLNLLRQTFGQSVFIAGGLPVAMKDSDFVALTEFGRQFLSACNRSLEG